jgi:hypothetical protein
MFNDKSRYRNTEQYTLKDSRGRVVKVVAVPEAPLSPIIGYHILKQGQRPDHLAAQYLNDPAGFWKIAEANDVMLAETLTEQPEIAIPDKH